MELSWVWEQLVYARKNCFFFFLGGGANLLKGQVRSTYKARLYWTILVGKDLGT